MCPFLWGSKAWRDSYAARRKRRALEKFFMNTLDRNGRGQRPDVHVPVPAFGIGRSEISDLSGDTDCFYRGLQYGQWYHDCTLPVSLHPCAIPSQMWNKSVFDALAVSVQGTQNTNHRKGTDVFVPRLHLCKPNDSQLSDSAFSIRDREITRNRHTRHFYREIHRGMKKRIPESMHGSLSPRSAPKSDKAEVPSEIDEGGNGSHLDLSLEEFPLLPCTVKPMPPNICQSGQLAAVKTTQVQHSSSTFTTINFGTYRHEESSESNGETIPRQPYQLEDDMDFPPLCF
ncbi:hypothetical protein FNV43_RR11693 [Rhamnella rubrinervis]|uniref:Uncharacterized protein n=1 Tax=Rhamnella rubrinervis TaxID=2594499 RepID=A0A8K0H6H2_9ROSA|nr:hypothetical protein FNV43_RR11693 [Rhamnella rubrinervis]